MSQTHLVLCKACARHVRASEVVCPFCGERVPDAVRNAPAPRRVSTRGLSRTAIAALGASTLSFVACGGGESTPDDGGSPMNHDGSTPDSGPIRDAGPDQMGMAAYGAPALPPDGGDAGGGDAGDDSGPIIAPAYGLVPPDGG
jgi:hypothetical protein